MMEVQLPPEIIQHLQSFMGIKEAAGTSLLSKSWYSAWSTGRIMSFDLRNLEINARGLPRRTIQRYKRSNLNIDKFMLYMSSYCRDTTLVDDLIIEALSLGVNDFNLKSIMLSYVLPAQVFASGCLSKLSLNGCQIDPHDDIRMTCFGLVFLSLHRVKIHNDMIGDIIWKCPLIEYFDVSLCDFVGKIDACKMRNLKTLILVGQYRVEIAKPSIYKYPFPCLRCLYLDHIRIYDLFYNNFSSKFPCLEDLTIINCSGRGCQEMQISSHSLKLISFRWDKAEYLNVVQLDVPNIIKFKYVGGHNVPSLSFANTTSISWESDIAFDHIHGLSMIAKLRSFLMGLSHSRINLKVSGNVDSRSRVGFNCGNFLLPEVENVTLTGPYYNTEYHVFLECLLSVCRPNFITHNFFDCQSSNYTFRQFICKKLKELLDSKQNSLKKFHMEYFEKILMEWKTIPLGNLSSNMLNQEEIRFQLRWWKVKHGNMHADQYVAADDACS